MKTLLTIAIILFSMNNVFASDFITCESIQTEYTYQMYPEAGQVIILDANMKQYASAELTFEKGTSEDVLFWLKSGPDNVGVLNGEEGIQGRFDHGVFESNLVDSGLTCTRPTGKQKTLDCTGDLEDGFELHICQNVEHPNNGITIDCTGGLEDGFEANLCQNVPVPNN